MLPDEMLIMPPSSKDTDSTVSMEQEDMLLGEEVDMVLRMKEEEWIRTEKLLSTIRRLFSVPE